MDAFLDDSRLKPLLVRDQKIRRLGEIKAALEWDQETGLPADAVDERAEQLALLEGLIHEEKVSPAWAGLFKTVESGPPLSVAGKALVRELQRDLKTAWKLPAEFVEREARLVSKSQSVWAAARRQKDFAAFLPSFASLVAMAREKADLLGWSEHPYDALLDLYEPGATTKDVKRVLGELETGVVGLVRAIAQKPVVSNEVLTRSYPRAQQEAAARRIAADLGLDAKASRLDVTTHPFCTTLGPRDVRITTRYDEGFFATALYGVIHETGHALYEQGVDPRLGATVLGGGTSLGMHESQSRFWENRVGRSKAFIEHYWPVFKAAFPESLSDSNAASFYRAVNRVEPSFIRVEADEVTYSLHILLRFRLETALLDGSLLPADVPEAWNQEFQRLFGKTPPDNAQGCLQDVHWAMGGIGYFPTYALGNLYAAQLTQTMVRDLDLDQKIAQGDFAPVLAWLRQKIHQHGRIYSAAELCVQVTGRALEAAPFLSYLTSKYGELYGL